MGSCGTVSQRVRVVAPSPAPPDLSVSGLILAPVVRVGILTEVTRVSVGCDAEMIVKAADREGKVTERRVYRATFRAPSQASSSAKQSRFRVQVASLADARAAKGLAEELRQGGRPLPAVRSHEGTYQVRVGDFARREEAQALALELGRNGYPGAWVAEEAVGPGSAGELHWLETGENVSQALLLPGHPGDLLWVDSVAYRGLVELRPSSGGGFTVINVVNVEDYLKGVVPNELSPQNFPEMEAQKAQAVAARTYVLRNRGQFASEGYDICATPKCQVYKGQSSEQPLSSRAVDETRGIVARYRGSPINALYTSTCGGHTEDADNIFEGEGAPYLRGVACAPERDAWGAIRTVSVPKETNAGSISHDIALLRSLDVIDAKAEAAGFKGVLGDEELRRWTSRLLLALHRAGCASSAEPPLNRRGSYFTYLVESLCWEERGRRLLGLSDIPYLLQLDDRDELPAGEELAVAVLIQENVLSPDPDNKLRPNSAITRAQALALLARVADRAHAPQLRRGEFLGAKEKELTVKMEQGAVTYPLDPALRLFRVLDGTTLATSELSLAPGDKVRFVLGGGRVVLLEGEQSRLGTALDRTSRYFRWEVFLSPEEVGRLVSRYKHVGTVKDVVPRRLGVSGRVVELAVTGMEGDVVLSGLNVRWGLGLRENLFVIDRELDPSGGVERFVFTGKGWGHGVGLCQVGAHGMAQAGATYETILRHYYSGVTLDKAYGSVGGHEHGSDAGPF